MKPENLLLDASKQTIKLVDFGLGNTWQKEVKLDTFCGSPYYAAPEMIAATPYNGPEVDVWSAGVILNRLHGHWQFLLIYLGSAIVGSALSLHYAAQTSVAVGASGAVFGVLGAVLVSIFQNKSRLPTLMTKNSIKNL